MADEREQPKGAAAGGTASGQGEGAPAPADPGAKSAEAEAVATAGENLRRGVGLLLEAARQAAEGVKRGLETHEASGKLRETMNELDKAAAAAVKGIERFVSRFQPPPPRYEREVPEAERQGVPDAWAAGDKSAPEGFKGGDKPAGDKPAGGEPKS
ncbi:MAG: hypothetical protein IT373_13120 [Polyangiaceae bacterium]|nr:hypothetical protein [Polyangiaceae bacterium]